MALFVCRSIWRNSERTLASAARLKKQFFQKLYVNRSYLIDDRSKHGYLLSQLPGPRPKNRPMPNPTTSPAATTEPGAIGLDKKDWIAGLEKGLGIIEAFDDAHPRMTASQAGERCSMTRTAARRYLLTLQHLGYVATDGKLFWLTPRVLRLGQSYLESARLPRIVQPFLQRVTAGTQEIAYVSVLDGDDVVYIARNGTNRSMNTGYVLGARVQAQVTAAGMLMLSMREPEWLEHWLTTHELKAYTSHTIASKDRMRVELARIRQQGWAVSEQQLELNHRGVAVPLMDRHGDMLGALNVTMPMGNESTDDAIHRVLAVLQETARAMRNLI
jgi:IclR family pca regulon transcriptional regulator